MTFRQRFDVGWRLLRPFTLTASIVPVLVGTGMAITLGRFHTDLFISFFFACILIQSATNMFNEYFDYKRGLDTKDMVGIAGTIVRDGVHPRTVFWLGWLFIALSVLLGIYICVHTTWLVALVGVLSMCVGYFYSGGPKPLAYTPFGELAASVAMGPVIVLLAFFIQTGELTWHATAVSVPIGLLIGAILFANNLRDMEQDKVGGRRTIAIVAGRQRARVIFGSVFVVTYLTVMAFVAMQWLTPWALVVLLTIPSAVYVTKLYYQFTEPARLHVAVKGTSQLLFRFGMLMFCAMIASVWVHI
ncbi:MAG: 1,4-dihydroxy-2-naphthoate polyprenyltransferase [Alicyclobacillus sp.]|nr:1,4-dihydroxy-2-naphthoate polyprenyltransferase [Alicyclobacillus sp.]